MKSPSKCTNERRPREFRSSERKLSKCITKFFKQKKTMIIFFLENIHRSLIDITYGRLTFYYAVCGINESILFKKLDFLGIGMFLHQSCDYQCSLFKFDIRKRNCTRILYATVCERMWRQREKLPDKIHKTFAKELILLLNFFNNKLSFFKLSFCFVA